MNFKDLIFPHIGNKKQYKESQFVLCYNLRIVDYRSVNDDNFKNYLKAINGFVQANLESNLVGEEVNGNLKNKMKQAFFRSGNGKSAEMEINFISQKEKQTMDDYLIMSGWSKKLDKYSYIYEGCLNDDKLFIGGKNELLLHYCKLFPHNSKCVSLKKTFELASNDKRISKVFSNPEMADKAMDNFVKLIEKDISE